jgi:hypothetical protein
VKKFVQQGLMMAAGFFVIPAAVSHADQSVHSNDCRQDDPRLASLRRFFHAAHSPLERMASVFISEADIHHLDWRLLPGLSFVETSGGKTSRGNNVFGWNNGNSAFRSVREGIHVVASRLAYSPYYRGKSVVEKLQTYNRNPEYVASVQNVMRRISFADAAPAE